MPGHRRAVALDLDGENGDLSPFAVFDELAATAKVAYLVEMDHFIHEKFEFRLQCVRYLASRGWRWLGEELDWREGERIDRYLRTGDESALTPVDSHDWYTAGVLREPMSRRPTRLLNAEQQRFARAIRRQVPQARYFGFDVGGADREYLAMANAATTHEDLLPVMAYRERLMYEHVGRVLRDNPGEKVILMAGSLHLMKDDTGVDAPGVTPAGGGLTPSIGHHVAHNLADGPVLSLWLLHGSGPTASPYLQPPTLQPAAGTLDEALLSQWNRPCLMVVDGDSEACVTQMHNQPVACHPLAEQVDGIVFTPTVSRLRS